MFRYCNDSNKHQYNNYVNYITGGDDYDSGPYNINFTAGMTSSSLAITINDDNIFEDNENFTVTIDSDPSTIAVGDPHQATVTIVDNEGTNHYSIENKNYL